MRDPKADPDAMRMEDFWCDFCRAAWSESLPMVEGHQGSLICGTCLTIAYREVIVAKNTSLEPGAPCVMCLEHRRERNWSGPRSEGRSACERCIRQAAATLEHDGDAQWRRPDS